MRYAITVTIYFFIPWTANFGPGNETLCDFLWLCTSVVFVLLVFLLDLVFVPAVEVEGALIAKRGVTQRARERTRACVRVYVIQKGRFILWAKYAGCYKMTRELERRSNGAL